MTITYPEITNLIMATDALRASLSSEKAEQLRVLDADLTLALWQLIPQAASWLSYRCPGLTITDPGVPTINADTDAEDSPAVVFTVDRRLADLKAPTVVAALAWRVMHLYLLALDGRAAVDALSTAVSYIEAIHALTLAPIPPRTPRWY